MQVTYEEIFELFDFDAAGADHNSIKKLSKVILEKKECPGDPDSIMELYFKMSNFLKHYMKLFNSKSKATR